MIPNGTRRVRSMEHRYGASPCCWVGAPDSFGLGLTTLILVVLLRMCIASAEPPRIPRGRNPCSVQADSQRARRRSSRMVAVVGPHPRFKQFRWWLGC
jgi:hypothetical protein